jgi:hypothetical protein
MSGIVGILGTGPVAGLIVDALERLEYRDYDSAYMPTLENPIDFDAKAGLRFRASPPSRMTPTAYQDLFSGAIHRCNRQPFRSQFLVRRLPTR